MYNNLRVIYLRLKNVKDASKIISASNYVIKNPSEYKSKWNDLFENNNPIDIEIGMGKGDFIIGMAKKNPHINYIGIEMFDSVIVRAVQKLENADIPNLKLIRMDASNIEDVFDKEIDTLYLNFSDPWPKKRHEKRRLTSHNFLAKYDSIFKGTKKIVQKTDNKDLFCFSLVSFSTYGYVIDDVTLDLKKLDDIENVPTEYEKRFNEKNISICRVKVHKKD